MTSLVKIRQAARVIRAGGVVAYPTEAVFGLGCDPGNADAVRKILKLKRRPESAGLILIAADLDDLRHWIAPDPDELNRLTSGAEGTTWVVSAGPATPYWISGGRDTVAVRVTRHPAAAALCRDAGIPIVSTSANRRGHAPAGSALEARRAFRAGVDFVLPGATGPRERPSQIRIARSGEVLRA